MSDHADFEAAYWGDCCNTFDEEQKHYIYATYMGISKVGYSFNAGSKRVLDIGGGPVSMLLKCVNHDAGGTDPPRSLVADPLMRRYPQWVHERYRCAHLDYTNTHGEDPDITLFAPFDEVWIYNVLQHVEDPAKVIANAFAVAPVLRLFEWVDIPPHEGHPHMLTAELLQKWLGQPGNVVQLAEQGCFGKAFYGVFVRFAGA